MRDGTRQESPEAVLLVAALWLPRYAQGYAREGPERTQNGLTGANEETQNPSASS